MTREPNALPFKRMNGLGNTFIVLDGRTEPLSLTPHAAHRLSDPANGPGCDQLIVLEPGTGGADIVMRIYNCDGSEVDACGNATRCIAWMLEQETAKNDWAIKTNAGLLRAKVDGNVVRVDMGAPKFDWTDIPLNEPLDTRLLDIRLGPLDNPVLFEPSAVNVGNPHCIFFVDDVTAHDLEKFGPLVENHPLFPERTNVELAQVIDHEHIRVRVWERGVGITQACGTGACAVVPAAVRKNLAGRTATVTLDGGDLLIEWDAQTDHIFMTGTATYEYDGELDRNLLA